MSERDAVWEARQLQIEAEARAHFHAKREADAVRLLSIMKAERDQVHKWRPIETAPHNLQVLLYCPERGESNPDRIELGYASMGRRTGRSSSISYHAWATHWMPLPEPPR